MAKNVEPSAKNRTTSSKKFWKMNPGNIDDAMIDDLSGFKNQRSHMEDEAYGKILAKCSKGSTKTSMPLGSYPALTPPDHSAHDDFKDWSRGKSKEPK
jgi:hypothetical protein